MSSSLARRPDLLRVGLFVGALLGTALVAYATWPWGPAVNELALHHFTAAEGLRTGTGMTLSRGEPFVMWPPLMPVLLALAHSLGLDYPTAGLFFNLVAHTATLFLSAMLLWRLFGSAPVAIASQVMLLVSPELSRSAATLQTEPLFFAFVLAGLCLFVRYLESPTWPRLGAMTLAALLACLQRYTGVALVMSVCVVMLWFPRSMSLRTRIVRAAAYAFVAIAPLALWMLRNQRVNRTWGIVPDPSEIGLFENARSAMRVLARFLTLDTAMNEPLGAFEILSGLVAVSLFIAVLARFASAPSETERRSWSVYLAFPPVYLAVLLGVSSYVSVDPIGNRYVAPLYPFLWGTLLLGFREVHRRLFAAPLGFAWGVRALILSLFAAHVLLAVDRTRVFVETARDEGVGGFTMRIWQRSPLVLWLRANPPEGELYSNLPELVIFAIGRRAINVQPESLERTLEHAPSGAYLIWVERFQRVELPFPARPPSARHLALVTQLDSARVYRVEP